MISRITPLSCLSFFYLCIFKIRVFIPYSFFFLVYIIAWSGSIITWKYIKLLNMVWFFRMPEFVKSQKRTRILICNQTLQISCFKGFGFVVYREWQMERAFQSAMLIHNPEQVFILGKPICFTTFTLQELSSENYFYHLLLYIIINMLYLHLYRLWSTQSRG